MYRVVHALQIVAKSVGVLLNSCNLIIQAFFD